MPLSASVLKTGILTQMTAQGFDVSNSFSFANKLAEALADAIVAEFTANSGYNAHVHTSASPGNPTSPPVPTPQ
jgi:hypothetical protein